jgi:hypothetical protein
MHMAIERWDTAMAAHHGRLAIRRGDLATAERWFKLADRAAAIELRISKLADAEAKRRPVYNPPHRP